jgi:hypothetical protein
MGFDVLLADGIVDGNWPEAQSKRAGPDTNSTFAHGTGNSPRRIIVSPCRESDFWRECLAELDDLIQRIAEIVNSREGDDDGVAATTDLLGNPQKTASRILFESEREVLPLDRDAISL